MTVLQIVFIFKREHIIGCTVKNIAQFFNGKDCDVLIFPELIESVLVNSFVEYSCAVTPQVRQTGNRLSGLAGTAYASLLT